MNARRTFFALSLISSILCTLSTIADAPFTTQIDGMVGKIPLKICWYIKKLQEDPTSSYETFSNRLLLYGPPGNGKTTIARKMAELTNSNFYVLNAPSIVTKFAGSGPETIRSAFQDIRAKIFAEGRRVILFIDEIDAIAANVGTEYRSEHKLALQQLWLELDACKGDTRIFAIFATNHFDKLNKTFLDRFGSNVIKIDNPCTDTRLDALKMYFEKHGISVDDALLYKIAKMTKGLSIRCLEDLVQEISMLAEIHNDGVPTTEMVWQALAHTKSKFKNNKSTDTDDTAEQRALQHTLNKVSLVSNSIGLIGGLLTIILHGETLRAKFWPNEKEQERERLQDLGLLLNSAHLSKMLRLHENRSLTDSFKENPIYKDAEHAAALEKDLRSEKELLRDEIQDETIIISLLNQRKSLRLHEYPDLAQAIYRHPLYRHKAHLPAIETFLKTATEEEIEKVNLINAQNTKYWSGYQQGLSLIGAVANVATILKSGAEFKAGAALAAKTAGAIIASPIIVKAAIAGGTVYVGYKGYRYVHNKMLPTQDNDQNNDQKYQPTLNTEASTEGVSLAQAAYYAASWPVRKTYEATTWTAKKSYEWSPTPVQKVCDAGYYVTAKTYETVSGLVG